MMNSLKTFLSRMKNVNHVINKTFTESLQGHFGFIGRDHVTAKTCWTLIHEHKTYNPTVSSSNCFLSCFAKKHKCFANKMKLKCMCAFLIGPQSSSWNSPITLVSLNLDCFLCLRFTTCWTKNKHMQSKMAIKPFANGELPSFPNNKNVSLDDNTNAYTS